LRIEFQPVQTGVERVG